MKTWKLRIGGTGNFCIPGIAIFVGEKVDQRKNGALLVSSPLLLRELTRLVRLLEPLEQDGSLQVPGLATLNGARAAIAKATKP